MQPISLNWRQAMLIPAHMCSLQTSDRGDKPSSVHDSAVSSSVWLFIFSRAGLIKWVTVFICDSSFWTYFSWLFFSQGLPWIVHMRDLSSSKVISCEDQVLHQLEWLPFPSDARKAGELLRIISLNQDVNPRGLCVNNFWYWFQKGWGLIF